MQISHPGTFNPAVNHPSAVFKFNNFDSLAGETGVSIRAHVIPWSSLSKGKTLLKVYHAVQQLAGTGLNAPA
ncbi:MAG: hypothetical protein R2727_09770 [Bacteroidales bacterium]